ncbi:MAG: hypothetical protein CBARDMAM_2665 [uncultured Caballeronia sp.]|nr:MAG: hypothetical protein CBARDMAM_2665 [uncultured Caballeronia sp.]
MFELRIEDDQLKVVEERHYKLVPAGELDRSEIVAYRIGVARSIDVVVGRRRISSN